MKAKLDPKQIVLAAGATSAIIYIVCVAAYSALPKPAFDMLWKPMLHWVYGAGAGGVVLGLIEIIAYTIFTVAIFVLIYNYLLEKE